MVDFTEDELEEIIFSIVAYAGEAKGCAHQALSLIHIFMQLDKMGEKSVEKLLASIEKSKERPYSKTLYALGIPFVGKFLGNVLAKKSKNIDRLSQMSKEELLEIAGVGDKVAESVYNFFRDEKSMTIVKKLKDYGVNFGKSDEEVEEKIVENGKFSGKTFLFTGKLQRFKREEIKDLIESLGGTNLSLSLIHI